MTSPINEMRRHLHTAKQMAESGHDDPLAAARVAEKHRVLADTYAQAAQAEALTSIADAMPHIWQSLADLLETAVAVEGNMR